MRPRRWLKPWLFRLPGGRLPGALFLAALLLAGLPWIGTGVEAGPQAFDLRLNVPPVIVDSQAALGCTVTYLIADTANNDLFAARMRIASAETDIPADNRMPCPATIPPRVALRALDVCVSRSGEVKYCVFADMSRGFEKEPDIRNTVGKRVTLFV